ncbi:MAG: hypothetical protein WBC60_05055 [Cognaticolwellia sp.]|jgi:hypothetical protein
MLKNILISALFLFLLSGCQSTLMEPMAEQAQTNAKAGQSQVVFIRSAFIAKAIQASVYDVTTGTPQFIGVVSNDTKVSYMTSPGEHMFMVVGESADFLKATVVEGKTYYAVVSPRMGFWKARFSMHPVRNDESAKFKYDSKDFKEMLDESVFVQNGPKAAQWATSNANSISKKMNKYLPEWKSKAVEKQKAATIEVMDHM